MPLLQTKQIIILNNIKIKTIIIIITILSHPPNLYKTILKIIINSNNNIPYLHINLLYANNNNNNIIKIHNIIK